MWRQAIVVAVLLTLWSGELAGAAPRAITRHDQKDVMVTIYNGNLGLVKDTREVQLDAGTGEVQFADVAAQIDPTTVHLKSLTDPAGLKILEQNYEYDLLTSAKLMEKYVGKKVRLYQPGGTYQDATLLSTDGPIFEINGQLHVGHSGKVVLPALPENLVSRPTLVWLLRNAKAARQRVEASYLTGGITWKADYVVIVDAADARADLTGWVTIDNKSGATYSNALLKLVAGDVNRAKDRRDVRPVMARAAQAATPAAAAAFSEETFFEYHLYSLDGRTTIKDNQTKQLSLMTASGVAVDKHFVYSGVADYYRTSYGVPLFNQKVGVYLELKNSKDKGLGLSLPKGRMRVYKADASGSQQLVGEDWIDHTPRDEKIKIKLGDAFDVVGERVQRDWKKIAPGVYEVEWEIKLRNHKKEGITVEVFEPMPGDWEVVRATHPHEKPQAFSAKWSLPVPKDGETKLNYRVRVRW